MLDIDTSGIAAYTKWLKAETARIKLEVRQIFRQWAIHIHADITSLTPQWSGNMAANWALDIGSASTAAQYFVGPGVDQPFKTGGRGGQGAMFSRGMYPAVGISLDRAKQVGMPLLSDDLFIHNPVAYAQRVEDDTTEPRIRAINRWPRTESGKVVMVSHAAMKYSVNNPGLFDELRTRAL